MTITVGHKGIVRHDGSAVDGWFGYTCGHCGTKVTGVCGSSYLEGNRNVRWLLCPSCRDGSVKTNDGRVYPAVRVGPEIEGLPDVVAEAYNEARDCMSVNAFAGCELVCRTILMYVAVEKGDKPKKSFTEYIDYLQSENLITPSMSGWVDLVRKHGGKAAHTLEKPDHERAESTLMFTAELLRIVYEMESKAKKYTHKNDSGSE